MIVNKDDEPGVSGERDPSLPRSEEEYTPTIPEE